jgi:hypothetical protein
VDGAEEGHQTMSEDLSAPQVAAIMAAILEVTGARDMVELGTVNVSKEQWQEAYKIAGVPWTDYSENWPTH